MAGPNSDSFDFIVVGAGSAGCALANRLSEDGTHTVCLIEAGPPDRSPFIHVPAGVVMLMKHRVYNWLYATTDQKGAAGRPIDIPRGKTLGGSSSINGMIYMRGHPLDYDEWAELGCPGWSFAEVLPYFKRAENNQVFRDSPYHGTEGPLDVTMIENPNPLVEVLLQATDSLQIPRLEDCNGATTEGFGQQQVTIKNGRRHSAARAYLVPARGRANLTVITGALVDKVTLEGKRATGVELVQGGTRRRLAANREIVLSAGSIASPLILMRSGVGEGARLKAHGIEVRHELAGVGAELQDHVAADCQFRSPSAVPYGLSFRAAPKLAWNAVKYLAARRGTFASNLVEAAGCVKTDPSLSRPDVQFAYLPGWRSPWGRVFERGHGFHIAAVLLRPKSRGRVDLSGPDPAAKPLIDPRFFSAEEDLESMLKGYRIARTILMAPAFAPYRGEEVRPGAHVQSDDDLKDYIRANCRTVFHPVGTCRMGSDDGAVVDPELRVRGLDGLRVADGAIMPRVVGGNTNAPIIMIGEKCADMLLGRPPLAPETVPAAASRAG